MTKRKIWTEKDFLFILENREKGARWIADQLDAPISSLYTMASRRQISIKGPARPDMWTQEEDDIIRENAPHLIRMCDALPGRNRPAVETRARHLGFSVYITGMKKVWSSPNAAHGHGRKLLAQTCHECGLFKSADKFGTWQYICVKCRIKKRKDPDQNAYLSPMQEATLPAAKNGWPWTKEDDETLLTCYRGRVTAVETAKVLERTFYATRARLQKITELPEKTSMEWLIWFAEAPEPETRPEFEWDDEIGA